MSDRCALIAAEIKRQQDWEETEFWAHCPFCDLNMAVNVNGGAEDLSFYKHTGRYPAGSTFDHKRTHSAPICKQGSGASVPTSAVHWNREKQAG